jgi:hypothetical protein
VNLQYLMFDYSEDPSGIGSFDAMASAAPAQRPALEAEVTAVLGWAHNDFPDGPRGLDAGGEWDFALQGTVEIPQSLSIDFAPGSRTLRLEPGPQGPPRTTIDLTLSGSPAFCAAFRRAFHLD